MKYNYANGCCNFHRGGATLLGQQKGFFRPICALEFVSNVRHLVSPWLWRSSAWVGTKSLSVVVRPLVPNIQPRQSQNYTNFKNSCHVIIFQKNIRNRAIWIPKLPKSNFSTIKINYNMDPIFDRIHAYTLGIMP